MAAPVCRIAPPPPSFDSSAPELPSIPLVSINPQNWNIPKAAINDLKIMANAINTIRQAIAGITNRGAAPNNSGSIGQFGGLGGPTVGGGGFPNSPQQKTQNPQQPSTQKQKQQKKQGGGLVEIDRTVKKVRIFNPDDKTQYVDVNQITALTLKDPVTGMTWKWSQGSPLNPGG